MKKPSTCSVLGCGRKVLARGLCSPHYLRLTKSKLGLQPERAIGDITGAYNPKWRGGMVTKTDGRVLVYSPNHPNAHKDGKYVLRYRLEMEKQAGRFLAKSEIVHHKNGVTSDDVPDNLKVTNRSEHAKIHRLGGRNQKPIAFNGMILNTQQWASKLGIPVGTLYNRIYRGWTIEQTLTTPRKS